ncbi:MAG: hypothetical protein P4L53_03095 [Candidatus Obscuribacterales bacterium]|nr:hypothetical protein [Candidatus Obscuribacterales bacterium]
MNENSDQCQDKSTLPEGESRRFCLVNTQSWGVFIVVCYFICLFMWCCGESPVLEPVLPALKQVMNTAGLKQNWALFGPKTSFTNMHHLAKIRFADGTVKLYEWPRVDNVDLLKKGDYEPYSKLFTDNLPNDYSRRLRVSVARFIVRANINPANQPRLVTLIDVVSTIPDAFLFYNKPVMPPHTQIRANYVYRVQQKDLE